MTGTNTKRMSQVVHVFFSGNLVSVRNTENGRVIRGRYKDLEIIEEIIRDKK